mgnify:CR=1 FL=1
MPGMRDERGNFLGTIVENLTDDPEDFAGKLQGTEPWGCLGDHGFRSQALDAFQRDLWNSRQFWSQRLVYKPGWGSFRQVLVRGIGDELIWINV